MLFGTEEDQRRFRTAQNIRLANKEWDKLRAIAREARVNGGNALSVKNQLRAAIAAIGLGGAAAGALTMKAYQYVDNMFSGKRGPDTSSDPPGQKYYRMEGSDYADYDAHEQYDTEAMAREDAGRLDDVLSAAIELDRQDTEDREVVEFLQNQDSTVQRNPSLRGSVPEQIPSDLVLSVDDQHVDDDSFENFQGHPDINTQDLEPDPWTEDMATDAVTIEDTQMENGENVTAARAMGPNLVGSHNSMQVTPIAKIPPSFPFHQTVTAILEHHGSCSTAVYDLAETKALLIRMNTYVAPYSETTGTLTSASSWQPLNTAAWFPQALGRYVVNRGSTGDIIESLHNRQLSAFSDELFFSAQATDPYPAGADYYNLHYNAYTVLKCEWEIRVEVPMHIMKGNWTTDDTPDATETEASVIGNTSWEVDPPFHSAARLYTHYRMTGDTVAAVNPPLNVSSIEMERWDNTYTNKVTVPINGTRVIRGTWYPGKVKHNPLNDDDVQLWSAAGAVPAQQHLEHLVFQIKERPNTNRRKTTPPTVFGANISINCKWHVQFKERKTELQYPTTGQSNPAGTSINALVLQNTSMGGFVPKPV